jgi:hypothetical protein
MSRSSRRLAVLVAAVAVVAGGCASQDVDGSDAASVLDDAGAPKAVQTCVGDRIDDELDQDQKNEVGKADELSELPNELEQTVQGILDECVSSDGAATEGSDEGGSGDSSDTTETTETTEADGGTTTTSAPG